MIRYVLALQVVYDFVLRRSKIQICFSWRDSNFHVGQFLIWEDFEIVRVQAKIGRQQHWKGISLPSVIYVNNNMISRLTIWLKYLTMSRHEILGENIILLESPQGEKRKKMMFRRFSVIRVVWKSKLSRMESYGWNQITYTNFYLRPINLPMVRNLTPEFCTLLTSVV